jgi:hypothetical protein
MAKVVIELPDSLTEYVAAFGGDVTVTIPADADQASIAVENLLRFAIGERVGNAAAGEETAADKQTAIQKFLDDGKIWGPRGSGGRGPADPLYAPLVAVIKANTAKLGISKKKEIPSKAADFWVWFESRFAPEMKTYLRRKAEASIVMDLPEVEV